MIRPSQLHQAKHYLKRSLLLLLCLLFCGLILPASAAPEPTTLAAHPAALPQDFTLTDTSGVSRHLSEFRGRPTALFFFCGCSWCRQCAQTWGQFQRGGVLTSDAASSQSLSSSGSSLPATLIVFSGGSDAARDFASETGLAPAQTTILLDPDLKVTTAYHADPCPRVFVLDSKGSLRYTNNHKDDAARQAPALAIASRALDALREAALPIPVEAAPSLQATPDVSAKAAASQLSLPVTTLDGKVLDLAAQPGWKVIYFWSSTCPCVRACESFTFIPLARHLKSSVSFFAVASDGYDLNQPHSRTIRQAESHHLPFPVLRDDQHLVAKALGAKVTPQAFLLDPENRMVFAGLPDDSRRYQTQNGKWGVSQTYLAQAIRQAQAGQPVTAPQISNEGCIVAW